MDLKIIDNFFSENEFDFLLKNTIDRCAQTPFIIESNVENNPRTIENEEYWSWYMIHPVYFEDVPLSKIYSHLYEMFVPKFVDIANFKTMIRIKINAYPHTNEVKEHIEHFDYPFSHKGALFSLNTCDGYTKFNDGTKVQSVANRIVFFDASKRHQSTTTSNAKLRYNINLNFL